MQTEVQDLIALYQKTSKHSNYQSLPSQLQKLFPKNSLEINSRHEEARLDYMLQKIDVDGTVFCDIGGNIGFFSFELLEKGAKKGIYYEGNPDHAAFVQSARDLLHLTDRLEVHNAYFDFQKAASFQKADVTLLLNVLHHVGDDYGTSADVATARELILDSLNRIAASTSLLVFQLGFNWMGKRDRCLFHDGTKREMIDWLKNELTENWQILHIGIAEKQNNQIAYHDLDDKNIERNDSLGEFLNRPLFILKSRRL